MSCRFDVCATRVADGAAADVDVDADEVELGVTVLEALVLELLSWVVDVGISLGDEDTVGSGVHVVVGFSWVVGGGGGGVYLEVVGLGFGVVLGGGGGGDSPSKFHSP